MRSGIGWHIQREIPGLIRERPGEIESCGSLGYYQPPVVKVVWSGDNANDIVLKAAECDPRALMVVRPYEPSFGATRRTSAAQLVQQLEQRMGAAWSKVDAIEGLNENNPTNTEDEPDTAQVLADWYREFGVAAEAAGKIPVVCNWSTGQPWDLSVWDLFTVEPNWIIGFHAYYNPRVANNWLAIDAKAVIDSYHKVRTTKGPRYFLGTEYGIEPALYETDREGRGKTPWWEFMSAKAFVQRAIQDDAFFRQQMGNLYLGFSWFTTGGPGWEHIEVNRQVLDAMHPELRDADKAYPARPLPPAEEDGPPPPPPLPADWPRLRYFGRSEFVQPDRMDRNLLILLDRTREAYGKPLRITGSFRTPEHNSRVGGIPGSLHLVGQAVDFVPIDEPFSKAWLLRIAAAVIREWDAFAEEGWSLELEANNRPGERHVHLGIAYDLRPSRLIPRG